MKCFEDTELAEKVVGGIPRGELAEVWNRLNDYEWPEILGEAPGGLEAMPPEEQSRIVRPLMEAIECRASRKELLRYHHTVNLGSTDAQYEDWWDSMAQKELLEEVRMQPGAMENAGSVLTLVSLLVSIAAIAISLIATAMR